MMRLLTVVAGVLALAPSAYAFPQVPLPVFERHPQDPVPVMNTASGKLLPVPLPNLRGVPLKPIKPTSAPEECPTRLTFPQRCAD